MRKVTIDEVKNFWENNPLFMGESKFEVGSKDFFEEHKKTYYDDVFAGNFDKNLLIPNFQDGDKVLDLGCGVGFWSVEIMQTARERERE